MQDYPSAERKSRDTRHKTQYYYNQNKPKIHYGTSCNHPRHFVWHLQHPRCQPPPVSAGAKGVYPPSGRHVSARTPRPFSETSVEVLCPAEIAEIAEIFPAEGRSCVAVSKGDLSALSALSAGPINNISRT